MMLNYPQEVEGGINLKILINYYLFKFLSRLNYEIHYDSANVKLKLEITFTEILH